MPHMLAERLGVAALTGARKLTVEGTSLTIERQTEEGLRGGQRDDAGRRLGLGHHQRAPVPSFKGIMEAKKKPVQTLSLADLGIAAEEVGTAGSSTVVVEAAKRPPRQGGTRVVDEGEGGVKLVEFLASEKFV
jgi:electron transfer flavoprotein beta subunit